MCIRDSSRSVSLGNGNALVVSHRLEGIGQIKKRGGELIHYLSGIMKEDQNAKK